MLVIIFFIHHAQATVIWMQLTVDFVFHPKIKGSGSAKQDSAADSERCWFKGLYSRRGGIAKEIERLKGELQNCTDPETRSRLTAERNEREVRLHLRLERARLHREWLAQSLLHPGG